jgi:hypothetical protein
MLELACNVRSGVFGSCGVLAWRDDGLVWVLVTGDSGYMMLTRPQVCWAAGIAKVPLITAR